MPCSIVCILNVSTKITHQKSGLQDKAVCQKIWNLERSDLARDGEHFEGYHSQRILRFNPNSTKLLSYHPSEHEILHCLMDKTIQIQSEASRTVKQNKFNCFCLFFCFISGKEGFIFSGILRIQSMLVGKAKKSKEVVCPISTSPLQTEMKQLVWWQQAEKHSRASEPIQNMLKIHLKKIAR